MFYKIRVGFTRYTLEGQGIMFGIGLPELIIIAIIALIVIGPQKLPEMAKAFGRAFVEFKKAAEEIKNSVKDAGIEKITEPLTKLSGEVKPQGPSASSANEKNQPNLPEQTKKDKGSA